ncbi:hypothetical protein ABT381_20960 [Streptomyces sp. NPDC000151]|uniref:hypothetical protein n=1 Tax=Streptomyces sp. NPDC000151 TaxID=3154244 RepID=UPI00332B8E66
MTDSSDFSTAAKAEALPLVTDREEEAASRPPDRAADAADLSAERRALLLTYELVLDASEALSRHGVPGQRPAELKAAAARIDTLDEALSAIREIGRLATAVIAAQA